MTIISSGGTVAFSVVAEAMREEGIIHKYRKTHAILRWSDSIRDLNYFCNMNSWQVSNRIPYINCLCHKVPMSLLLMKIKNQFPDQYSFYPESFFYPEEKTRFIEILKTSGKVYIMKPDCGSLGQGIRIIQPGGRIPPYRGRVLVQEYIPSCLHENRKFDLRVYCLLASVDPLEIYVYRDGLARFCSDTADHQSIYSQLTNIAVNRKNADADPNSISMPISQLFNIFHEQKLINSPEELWAKIDDVITLTIFSAYKHLDNAVQTLCPNYGYSRCFQILGFDILLDKQMDPHLLEVNFRPSLKFRSPDERRMKVRMVQDSLKIAVPLRCVQEAFLARKTSWDSEKWSDFLNQNKNLLEAIKREKEANYELSDYQRVWPRPESPKQKIFANILQTVHDDPLVNLPGIKDYYGFNDSEN